MAGNMADIRTKHILGRARRVHIGATTDDAKCSHGQGASHCMIMNDKSEISCPTHLICHYAGIHKELHKRSRKTQSLTNEKAR
jgi:hypothetical protein